MQLSLTAMKFGLQTQRLTWFTICYTLSDPQGVTGSKQVPSAAIWRGGTQTQFPEASSTYPFLQLQNLFASSYFKGSQVRQSWAFGPLQVKHFGSHF